MEKNKETFDDLKECYSKKNSGRELVKDRLVKNLPALRQKVGVTQEGLALKLEVSRQTLSNIEAKRSRISWVMVIALIAMFEKQLGVDLLVAILGIDYGNID